HLLRRPDPDSLERDGLTAVTSLMVVVTLLSDVISKSRSLSGLARFVVADIGLVTAAVVLAVVVNIGRDVARGCSRGTTNCVTKFILTDPFYTLKRVLHFL
ncbi:hypothetical protein PFISCL1PPCAC_7766, partial [Pristionchus fissidentatus]